MNETTVRIEDLLRIDLVKKEIKTEYVFHPAEITVEDSFFGKRFKDIKEYWTLNGKIHDISCSLSNYTYINTDNKLVIKPRISYAFKNNVHLNRFFNTDDQALKERNRVLVNIKVSKTFITI